MDPDQIEDPRKEAAYLDRAKKDLAARRAKGSTAIYDVPNDPEYRNRISLDGPDDELIRIIVNYYKYEERLAAEVPQNFSELAFRPPKPAWQMTLTDFRKWGMAQNKFWTERVGAKANVEGLDKEAMWESYRKFGEAYWNTVLKEVLPEMPTELQNQIKNSGDTDPEKLERIYRQALTTAVDRGEKIPQEVVDSFREISTRHQDFYSRLETRILHKEVAAREHEKINPGISKAIADNFGSLYLKHWEKPEGMKEEFRKLLPGVEMEYLDGAYCFTDSSTNLVYVAIPTNSMLARGTWINFFGDTPGNALITKLLRPAVVVKTNAEKITGDWVLVLPGEVEYKK